MGRDIRAAAIAPRQVGGDAWRQWWRTRKRYERVLMTDEPPRCELCRTYAVVLWCEHRRDELENPQIERWCRCPQCGGAWRDLVTMVRTDSGVAHDVEEPFRAAVLRQAVEDALSKTGECGEQRS